MKKRKAIVGVAVVVLLSGLGIGTVEAGQASGSRNCGTAYIKTYGDGYGNQSHVVGASGTQWNHPIGTRAQHTYYSGYQSANWSVTTGGTLITATSNCYGG